MTTTHTTDAREAAHRAAEEYANEKIRPIAAIVDRGIDAFLSKTLEGADERVAEIRQRHETLAGAIKAKSKHGGMDFVPGNPAHDDRAELLALVTALSERIRELESHK